MVELRATDLGRLGWKPSPHPRAHALSCPSPAIYGPGLGHFTRPALCHRAGVIATLGSPPFISPFSPKLVKEIYVSETEPSNYLPG